MEKITIQQWSIPLASNLIIQTYTTNGEHYLPSLQNSNMIGFDDTCKINIQVPTSTTNLTTETFTTNGSKTPPSGYDGWSSININVPEKTLTNQTFTTNGRKTPPSGYDGWSSININVPQNTVNLTSTTFTSNGRKIPPSGYDGWNDIWVAVNTNTQTLTADHNDTYTPDSGYIGFSSVTVNVPPTAPLFNKISLAISGSYGEPQIYISNMETRYAGRSVTFVLDDPINAPEQWQKKYLLFCLYKINTGQWVLSCEFIHETTAAYAPQYNYYYWYTNIIKT